MKKTRNEIKVTPAPEIVLMQVQMPMTTYEYIKREAECMEVSRNEFLINAVHQYSGSFQPKSTSKMRVDSFENEPSGQPHARLRAEMKRYDVDIEYLSGKLLRGVTYVSKRMMGHEPWTLAECYQILDLLCIPHEKLSEYFPPYGEANRIREEREKINAKRRIKARRPAA